MRRLFGFVGLLAVTACGGKGKGDDCQRFWDKTAGLMQKMAGERKMPADAKDKFLKECREDGDAKKDSVFKCVLDANGEAAVSACMSKAFGDYMSASKMTEAKLNLNKLSKNLKVAYATEAAFPIGKVGPTPAEPCCKGAGGKCSTQEWMTNDVWTKTDFMVHEPHQFQYSYESDGKTVTATAIGDLDCDGTMITYKLEMSATPDGNVTSNVVEPPADSD